MFTVCPKCALTLAVTAADLRVAQGYVRCGRCSSVFNALARLTEERQAGVTSEPLALLPETAPAAPEAARPEAAAAAAPPAAADTDARAVATEESLEFNPATTDVNSVFVQATGTVSRSGSGFVFDPERFYVGGCPMTRLLFLKDYAMKKLLYAQPPPDDVVAAWSKLSDVSISGTSMTLKMP